MRVECLHAYRWDRRKPVTEKGVSWIIDASSYRCSCVSNALSISSKSSIICLPEWNSKDPQSSIAGKAHVVSISYDTRTCPSSLDRGEIVPATIFAVSSLDSLTFPSTIRLAAQHASMLALKTRHCTLCRGKTSMR